MKKYLGLIFGASILMFPAFLFASDNFEINFAPLAGYEQVQKTSPYQYSVNRFVYGGRVIIGLFLFSAEAEYLHGTDSETFASQNLSTTDVDDEFKVGLRSNISLGHVLSFYVRAGGQGLQNKHTDTTAGVSTTTTQPITYSPYAGAGLRVRLSSHFHLTGDFTMVFVNFPSFAYNNYQALGGIVLEIP
jgi:hypothetical protein